jgi:predicted HTH transcriptional regulator
MPETAPVAIDGKTVLVVRVPEGDQKLYVLRQGNHIYVRHGANNVRPDPDDIPQLLSRALRDSRADLGRM